LALLFKKDPHEPWLLPKRVKEPVGRRPRTDTGTEENRATMARQRGKRSLEGKAYYGRSTGELSKEITRTPNQSSFLSSH
jgi:hypothetical protein